MKGEIWKDIKDYEGRYKISNMGNVKSLPREGTRGGLLKPFKIGQLKHKYIAVKLTKSRKNKKIITIHKLVAQAFIPNPYNLPEINHKDENKQNNRVDNLEWCTRKYNINYGARNKRSNEKRKKKIRQYDLDGNFVKEWESLTIIANTLKVSMSSILYCCKGKNKTSHGYIWRYANERGIY